MFIIRVLLDYNAQALKESHRLRIIIILTQQNAMLLGIFKSYYLPPSGKVINLSFYKRT